MSTRIYNTRFRYLRFLERFTREGRHAGSREGVTKRGGGGGREMTWTGEAGWFDERRNTRASHTLCDFTQKRCIRIFDIYNADVRGSSRTSRRNAPGEMARETFHARTYSGGRGMFVERSRRPGANWRNRRQPNVVSHRTHLG